MLKKINLNKKKLIIALMFLIIGIIIIFTSLLFKEKPQNNNNPIQEEVSKKLTGRDRVYAQEETIEILKEYLKNIPIYEYGKNNNIVSISIFDLSKEFDLDISKFNNLKYDCNKETTTIQFNDDYTKYYINLDCKAFYSE